MMVKVILCLTMSANVFAATVEEAAGLFEARGAKAENAVLAASMYKELANKASDSATKGILKTKEAQALYYVGNMKASDNEKKEVYKNGMDAASAAISSIDSSSATKSDKALAHYFYSINLGKWAEANGVLSSLGKWPELKEQLDTIATLDNSIDDYGPLRTRARALHKLPFGDKDDAEKLLAEAYSKTINETYGVSTNTTTNIYFLDILAKNRKTEKFCEVFNGLTELSQASDEELLELNPAKLPETKIDLKKFKENKGFEEDVKKFADRNC